MGGRSGKTSYWLGPRVDLCQELTLHLPTCRPKFEDVFFLNYNPRSHLGSHPSADLDTPKFCSSEFTPCIPVGVSCVMERLSRLSPIKMHRLGLGLNPSSQVCVASDFIL